ncbi:hypothetical protein [Sphingosinicella soli]|uniref:Uncharacterized protein n=1 Tax=Sphingosinicella soli TaxID=333708 RepID=A0A7W7B1V7_9SPHN|nr:hypothetical protein [Sphingosinicella soli]MBB4631487.1 hypothetical protein [Sphingosinicella soli]
MSKRAKAGDWSIRVETVHFSRIINIQMASEAWEYQTGAVVAVMMVMPTGKMITGLVTPCLATVIMVCVMVFMNGIE